MTSRPPFRRSVRSLLCGAAAIAGIASAATTAHAATYAIHQCSDSSAKPAEVLPGFVVPAFVAAADRCGTGGQYELTAGDNRISQTGDWQSAGFDVRLPASVPNVRIRQLAATMSIASKTGDPVLSYGHIAIAGDGGNVFMEGVPGGAWPGFTDHTLTGDFPAGTRAAQTFITCYGACVFGSLPTMSVRRLAIVLDDSVLPAAAKPELVGLLDGTPQTGVRALRSAAGDADSGVQRVELHGPNGALIASTAAGAGCSYTRPAPCPQSRPQEEISVDTAKLTAGVQTLELWTVDAAGNVLKTALPAITVGAAGQPSQPPPSTSVPAVRTKAKVTFKVSSSKPRRGARVTLSGTVAPAPANKSRVMIETRGKKGWITAAVVSLRAGGKYSWSHRFGTRGSYTMRARLLGTGDALVKPGTSTTRSFRVR